MNLLFFSMLKSIQDQSQLEFDRIAELLFATLFELAHETQPQNKRLKLSFTMGSRNVDKYMQWHEI